MQYAQVFNHLCQYAGYHADSDARKRDHFRQGLNTKLKERLNLVRANNFNELVNMAITQEDCISAHRAEKKRKAPTGPATTQPSSIGWSQVTPLEPRLEAICLADG
jgi:predicted GIY-YIG superfamily endonuclease